MALCGPSSAEQVAQGEQSSLALAMNADFNTRFAQQSQILNQINQSISPIIAAGQNQQGFSPEELAALNTQAINTSGAAARNAKQAAGTAIAGEGQGGGSGLQGGITQAINAGIESQQAGALANTENQITLQNYQTGRQQYNQAMAGAQALSGEYNPQSFGSQAAQGFSTSFGEANQINQQKNAAVADIAGIATGGLSTGLKFLSGGLGNLGGAGTNTSAGENVGNFFGGGFSALAG